MGMNKWNVSEEAMPTNIRTGNDLLAAIEDELVKLGQVTEWDGAIQGHADGSNKALVAKVKNASALTRQAFGASQEVNAMGNQLLEAGISDQVLEATNTTESVTDNPTSWLAR